MAGLDGAGSTPTPAVSRVPRDDDGGVSRRLESRPALAVRVSLLIPSHAVPTFSYLVPESLRDEVRVGTAVISPLSGFGRLGIVVGYDEKDEEGVRPLKRIRAVARGLSLPEGIVRLCGWAAGAAALPPHAVLRMALPPGLRTSLYGVRRPAPDWPWHAGETVNRTALRRALGKDGLRDAEESGRLVLSPKLPAPKVVEWAILSDTSYRPAPRAHRQTAILESLAERGGALPVGEVLDTAGTGREVLRRLVALGAVRLERRPEPAPVRYTRGSGATLDHYAGRIGEAFRRGGPPHSHVWRVPGVHSARAAAAVAREAVRRGGQALVLAPGRGDVEGLAEDLVRLLPAGLTVAPYHGGLGDARTAVYGAVRRGEADVLVGTRAAVLLPLERLGAVCVVDEPNEAYRASAAGYEGVPLHVRDLATARGRIEGAPVFFLSATPSLRLYAPESGAARLPEIPPDRWPKASVVDMSGTGASLSSALLDACRRTVRDGGRAAVVAGRAGSAAYLSCNACGSTVTCPRCDLPLASHAEADGKVRLLRCARCGDGEETVERCRACGSKRLSAGRSAGAERLRDDLASLLLGIEVGLATGEVTEASEAPVVVGTAPCVLGGGAPDWDLVAIPDADLPFSGGTGSAEKGFRLLYRAAERSRNLLLVQTRSPEHPALGSALRGDYESFAETELPKRRALGYPPHAHLAEIVLEGAESAVQRAVESGLRPALEGPLGSVKMLDHDAPPTENAGRTVRRVFLLRSRKRGPLAQAASLVARLAATTRGKGRDGIEARIDMDPEEA